MSAPPKQRTSKVASFATSIVLGAVVVLALALVLLGVLARPGANGVGEVVGHPVFKVLSGSMTPAFRPGDLIVDDPVTASRAAHLVPGDVITFHVPGSRTELVTHRIIAVRHVAGSGRTAYQTKGDANNAPDPGLVSPGEIVGTYAGRVPFGGYVLQALQDRVVSLALVLVPLSYLAVVLMSRRRRSAARRRGAPRLEGGSGADVEGPAGAERPLPAGGEDAAEQLEVVHSS